MLSRKLRIDLERSLISGNLDRLREIKRQGTNLDVLFVPPEFGKGDSIPISPLIYATRLNNRRSVNWLLDNGASVDLANARGETALHVAANRLRRGLVTRLVEAGARTDKLDFFNKSPLLNWLFAAQEDGEAASMVYKLVSRELVDRPRIPGFVTARGFAATKKFWRTSAMLREFDPTEERPYERMWRGLSLGWRGSSLGRGNLFSALAARYGIGDLTASDAHDLQMPEYRENLGRDWYFGDSIFAAVVGRYDVPTLYENPLLLEKALGKRDRLGHSPVVAAIDQWHFVLGKWLAERGGLDPEEYELIQCALEIGGSPSKYAQDRGPLAISSEESEAATWIRERFS